MSNQLDEILLNFKQILSSYIDECLKITKDLEPHQSRLMILKVVNEMQAKALQNNLKNGGQDLSENDADELEVEMRAICKEIVEEKLEKHFQGSQKGEVKDNTEIIQNELYRLLERSSGAFVIFEIAETGKFVQFSGSSDEQLLLDLPLQTLSHGELDKANILFSEAGCPPLMTYDVYEYPDGPPSGTQTSFNVTFGREVEDATTFTNMIFEQIFGADETTNLIINTETGISLPVN